MAGMRTTLVVRDPLCEEALRTNRELRRELGTLALDKDVQTSQRLRQERDEARAELDGARLYVWQLLPWKGYVS